jgi:hypothetical protein
VKLSKYSENRIKTTAMEWEVPNDFYEPIYNYLVHGFYPGSFFSALLANDMFRAIGSSHPNNTIMALKNLTGWIRATCGHSIFWGSAKVVQNWIEMSDEQRREKLELLNLIYPEKEEVIMILKDENYKPAILW